MQSLGLHSIFVKTNLAALSHVYLKNSAAACWSQSKTPGTGASGVETYLGVGCDFRGALPPMDRARNSDNLQGLAWGPWRGAEVEIVQQGNAAWEWGTADPSRGRWAKHLVQHPSELLCSLQVDLHWPQSNARGCTGLWIPWNEAMVSYWLLAGRRNSMGTCSWCDVPPGRVAGQACPLATPNHCESLMCFGFHLLGHSGGRGSKGKVFCRVLHIES